MRKNESQVFGAGKRFLIYDRNTPTVRVRPRIGLIDRSRVKSNAAGIDVCALLVVSGDNPPMSGLTFIVGNDGRARRHFGLAGRSVNWDDPKGGQSPMNRLVPNQIALANPVLQYLRIVRDLASQNPVIGLVFQSRLGDLQCIFLTRDIDLDQIGLVEQRLDILHVSRRSRM